MQRITARRVAGDESEGRAIERWVSIAWLSALVAISFAVVSLAT